VGGELFLKLNGNYSQVAAVQTHFTRSLAAKFFTLVKRFAGIYLHLVEIQLIWKRFHNIYSIYPGARKVRRIPRALGKNVYRFLRVNFPNDKSHLINSTPSCICIAATCTVSAYAMRSRKDLSNKYNVPIVIHFGNDFHAQCIKYVY
jgi:hypothetical protein